MIEGRVEGKVLLRENSVTVGKNGRVKADIYAKSVTVEGEVEGDLLGQEEVLVRQSGKVRGNIQAPRVSLDSGCRFQGSIDMDKPKQAAPQQVAAPKREPAVKAQPEKPVEGRTPPLKPAARGTS